jgi:hypothetical protein
VAYKAEIQIGVLGLKQLEELDKRLTGINNLVNALNKTAKNPVIDTASLDKAAGNIGTLNKQLERTLQLQQQINKQSLTPQKPGGGGGGRPPSGGGGGGRPPSGGAGAGGLAFNPNPSAENLALGAGFPLLFGGGAGQVAGGLLGSFFGSGFGGQILGSAIGQQLEDSFTRIAQIGQALDRLNVDTLRDSVILVNRDLDYQVTTLIAAGKADAARLEIAKAIYTQTGLNAQNVQAVTNASNNLTNAWNQFIAAVSSSAALLITAVEPGVTAALKFVGLLATSITKVVAFGQASKDWVTQTVYGEKVLAKVKEQQRGINEEVQKADAAARLQTDELDRQIRLNTELFAIEKNRLEGSNRAAQTSQALAEKDAAYATIKKDLETEISKIYTDNKDVSQDTLNLLIGQTEALAQQKRNSADLAASRRLQKIDNDAILASLQAQADVLAFETQQTQAVSSARAQFLQLDQARLQKQQELTTSLNQEAGLINQLAQLRIQAATEEYQSSLLSLQAAVERAQAEYNIVNAKYAQNNANLEEVDAAGRKVALAQQALALESGVAAARLEQVRFTEEISRRQALVNAYAQEYERTSARTLQVLQQQTSALDNQARLASAVSQAAQTINNIEIQALERDLQRVTSTRERADIIKRIHDLEVDNARVVLLATRAQIRADLARADIAFRTVQLEFRKLQAVVALARAQGVLNQGHLDALNAQRSALIIAADTLNVSKQVAGVQLQAADAVYKAAVNAAKLRSEMLSAAGAAQSFAGAASAGAMAAGAGAAAVGQTRVLSKQTDPTKPGYYAETILPDGRRKTTRTFVVYDPRTANRIRPLTQNPLANTLNAPPPEVTPDRYVIPQQPPTTGAASVNITTGPVLQQDGQRYVTLGDLENAMQQVVGTVLNNGRTYSGRRYAGIR